MNIVKTTFRDGSRISAVECRETKDKSKCYCDVVSNKFAVNPNQGYDFGVWVNTAGQSGEMTNQFGFIACVRVQRLRAPCSHVARWQLVSRCVRASRCAPWGAAVHTRTTHKAKTNV